MSRLIVALPTGRIGKELIAFFESVDITNNLGETSRKLKVVDERNNLEFIFVKPTDILTYVTNQIADIGIVGRDSILEEQADIYELFDLGLGKCQLAVAGYPNTKIFDPDRVLRVATKYPTITSKFFAGYNQKVDIIKLNGSIEIAPILNLSDVIVDIVQSGRTLKENGLSVLLEMEDVSAKIISNKVSFRYKNQQIEDFIQKCKEAKR